MGQIKTFLEDLLDSSVKIYTAKEKVYRTLMGAYKAAKPVTKQLPKYFGKTGKGIDKAVIGSEKYVKGQYSAIESVYGPILTGILNLYPSKKAQYQKVPEIKNMISKYK